MNRVFYPNRHLQTVMGDLATDVETMMGHLFGEPSACDVKPNYAPRFDVSESETAFEVVVDLPGVEPDSVNVEINEDELTISGSRVTHGEDDGKTYHRSERTCGNFHRSVNLPTAVDRDKVEATFNLGVLTILLPKSEKVLPTKIEIKTSNA